MKLFQLICSSTLFLGATQLYAADDISGVWRTIDDKTGFSKALVEVKKDSDGTFSGKVIKILPRPGYTPKTHCQKCPAPYTNKPILGLTVLDNMKPSKDKTEYEGGTILDPLSGKTYKSKIKVTNNGNRLRMRGYVGVEVFGRSQTWIRDQ
ncbi:Uncharacterized conserved protein, DUF2147 family [Acinetobacter marinus]|uniref:Uncharacterized conserved protein, DUF2147 family n=1 Tax=Acinetobacter marinus TaxID=281375 RepID=A0A1G6M0P5_9GAMM|nr:DUF2147 domain-containing protein [Acinetobacter marinus]SDC48526.1 Uncharacterized conserved protein, DUF2147 family [Acinetobacter marinus]